MSENLQLFTIYGVEEEAYSTSSSPNATRNATASVCIELKDMLESSNNDLKLEAIKDLFFQKKSVRS